MDDARGTITPLQFEAYIRQSFALRGLPVDRCSAILFSQLAHMPTYRWGVNYPFQFVEHEIRCLEGGGNSSTKPAKPFSKNPGMRGLMHKHFYVPGYEHPRVNAELAWKLKNGQSRELSRTIAQIAKLYEDKNSSDIQGFATELAQEFLYGRNGLATRLQGKATGDWLIYVPFEGKNYYLCIAKHDEEAFIMQTVDLLRSQFPFLEVGLDSPSSST